MAVLKLSLLDVHRGKGPLRGTIQVVGLYSEDAAVLTVNDTESGIIWQVEFHTIIAIIDRGDIVG